MTDAPHPALLPTGMHDLLPPEAEIEAQVVAQLMATLAAHGYERVKPPLVEFEETLFAGAGAAMALAGAALDTYKDAKKLIEDMLPRVADEGLAEYCDVFCEHGVFTPEESIEILEAGRASGLRLRWRWRRFGWFNLAHCKHSH